MVKNKSLKKVRKKKEEEFAVKFWLVDGFVGILALMIYNFLLYIIEIIGIKGLIGEMENTMGYFCLNSFIDFGFNPNTMTFGLIIVFIVSFFLGIITGHYVRRAKKKH